MQDDGTVMMAHGSGGTMMRDIIEELFFDAYGGDVLRRADDAASLDVPADRIAFSTDTFVVTPHFFPGGDIGHLAVCGTVNDVATSGAVPKYLSAAFVLEEGYPLADLRRICASMAATAREAGVEIVTGDTKVVNKGHGDGVYINTAGVGILPDGVDLSASKVRSGDKILVSGTIGDHGIAIVSTRGELSFSADIESDAAPLNHLIAGVLDACPAGSVRAFRDPTRGGLASTLNEFAASSQVAIRIDEESVPVRDAVRGAAEMLGYDVYQIANEGKMVCAVAPEAADAALRAMRDDRYGADAAIIGEVLAPGDVDAAGASAVAGRVSVRTAFGAERILDMLVGEQLPRIC